MLTAFILVTAEREYLETLGDRIAGVEGIAEAYTVTGPWDFVAVARVAEHEDLVETVTRGLARLEGIVRTETLIAFQVFSRHDLARMWSLGFEPPEGSAPPAGA